MFVPQVTTAILASLLGAGLLWPGLARRASEKTLLLAGLLADLTSMALLIVSGCRWIPALAHPGRPHPRGAGSRPDSGSSRRSPCSTGSAKR